MIATHVAFDAIMNVLIALNMIPISLELSVPDDIWYMVYLKYVNYVYCALYVLELIIKVSVAMHHYSVVINCDISFESFQ